MVPTIPYALSNIVSKKPSELQRRSAPEPLRLTDFSSSQQPLGAGRELRGTYHFAQCPADCTCSVLSRMLAAAGLVRTIGIARAKAKIGLIKLRLQHPPAGDSGANGRRPKANSDQAGKGRFSVSPRYMHSTRRDDTDTFQCKNHLYAWRKWR